MSKLRFEEDSPFKKFMRGGGFYIALAVVIVAVAMAAYGALGGSRTDRDGVQDITVANPVENVTVTVTEKPTAATSAKRTTAPATEPKTEPKTEPVTEPATEPTAQPAAAKTQAAAEFFIMPFNGDVLNGFSDGKPVLSKTFNDYRAHNGMDIAAEAGSEIKSAGAGVVKKIYGDPLFGQIVEIDHGNGITALYCGLDKDVPVREGDTVEPAEVIGKLSSVPCESGDASHLHFAMKLDGKYIDPASKIISH